VIHLTAHFNAILNFVGNAKQGLTESVFLFVSQLTPIVNVDLLIINAKGQTLLTWRNDEYYGPGWHVPGGIIRFKESASDRIHAVASIELGATVVAQSDPICVREVMAPNRDIRGHFISMLYQCDLTSELDQSNQSISDDFIENGNWKWHDHCPDNLISQHKMYQPFIKGNSA
jgi:ADP-ribose pyrophosphatase YjhB (NUDIX family)